MDLADKINQYESGEMSEDEAVEFFQELIDTHWIYHLQGHYQRTASHLINIGVCALPNEQN